MVRPPTATRGKMMALILESENAATPPLLSSSLSRIAEGGTGILAPSRVIVHASTDRISSWLEI